MTPQLGIRSWIVAVFPTGLVLLLGAWTTGRTLLTAADVVRASGDDLGPWVPGHFLEPLAATVAASAVHIAGSGPVSVRASGLLTAMLLTVAVTATVARRASARTAACATLLVCSSATFGTLTSGALHALPALLLVLAWLSVDAVDERPAVGHSLGFASAAVGSVLLSVALAPAVIALCALMLLGRRASLARQIAAFAVGAVTLATVAPLVPTAAAALARLVAAPSIFVRQPFYAVAFVQSAYQQALGWVTPAALGLLGVALFSRSAPRAAQFHKRWTMPLAMAALPFWAYAPIWMLEGLPMRPEAALVVGVGCAVLLAHAAEMLGLMAGRRTSVAVTAVLVLAPLASAATRDPAVTLRRDLEQHRSRFALLAWDRDLDRSLPIVVADGDHYRQLFHYAPDALRRRLVHLDGTPAGDRSFRASHPSFYVFEGAEVRSTLLMRLVADGVVLSESRSFFPRDLSLDAPAYLYRVERP